ncbi:MAG: sulfite exporter TauE/SafE family protein, partial [Pyrobaculum sp.]
FGATMGIYLVRQHGQVGAAVTRLALRVLLIVIIVVMSLRRVEWPEAREDRFTKLFDLRGVYFEQSLGREVRYAARNAQIAAVFLFLVGVISGTFGLGGGWALVPVLNLISGLPLKVAVATSAASIAVGDAAGLWVYYHHAYLLPEMFIAVVPGVVVGATLGAKVALRVKASIVKYAVMGVMLVSGIQLIIRGISSLI